MKGFKEKAEKKKKKFCVKCLSNWKYVDIRVDPIKYVKIAAYVKQLLCAHLVLSIYSVKDMCGKIIV